MKNLIAALGFVLTLTTSAAQAIPTLYFDGSTDNGNGINYMVDGGALNVSGSLSDTLDITPSLLTAGSTINFSALYLDFETIVTVTPFGTESISTRGYFSGIDLIDDLRIYDGSNNLLLSANFDSLSIQGADGRNNGIITGILNATDGSLMNTFSSSNLFALQLNLSTAFSDTMYTADFSGDIDGNIQGQPATVPEPSTLALLSLGFLITGLTKKNKRSL